MKNTITLVFLCITLVLNTQAQNTEEVKNTLGYKTISTDGAWHWFSDPRAILLNDVIYSGWVTSNGSIMVGSYNTKSGNIKEVNISPKFNKNDHSNPSLLILPDNRIMVFFSSYNIAKNDSLKGINYAISQKPEDISKWEFQSNITQSTEVSKGYCYTNPVMLSEENNRIFLFWRGGDFKSVFCYSDNQGKTWSPLFTLVKSSPDTQKKPYVKIASNGTDEIHFAFTDGHPRNEPLNSIYYLKYKKGKFFTADGSKIGSLKNLPMEYNECEMIFNGKKHYENTHFGVRAWIWDIAVAKDGKPIVVYSRLPEETKHQYYYAKWNGKKWAESKIADAGSAFPRVERKKEDREREPYYSGGVHLDHENTNTVYYSKPVNDVFEIFKAELNEDGVTWKETSITDNSKKDNVRPFAIRNAEETSKAQIIWMQNEYYSHHTNYKASLYIDSEKDKLSADFKKEDVHIAMSRVANWQINEPLVHKLGDWTAGALFAGMVEWAKVANDSVYFEYLMQRGNEIGWAQLIDANPWRRYHGDDYATGQMFVEMHRIYDNDKMIKPLERLFDFMLQYPSTRSLEFVNEGKNWPIERWSWCDALFMAPTVWAKLAKELDRKDYLNFMDQEYHATYDYLYNKEEHLFYRDSRYFDMKEENGKPVFWGRGNGWVIAGLPTILEEVPTEWEGKKFYETLFVEMAEKIASIQGANGYWRASLLDPESYPNPESSCTGFYTYALAWGINNGYLSQKKYMPAVKKGWKALVDAVYPDGKLGWVQPIGADPKQTEQHMTEVYGVGAFLLAGTEILKMSSK
ncbi:glycoside hydrolase family 88 protein [uncultured Algibacter sp.]|uniref:glycoside hydrolase family 88 protein n=1 Tax=uncultured Algibacter sp. TaxID=298659 RepID=UPI002633B26B|nr:glycoside hydrolase family 88 protein [uncultured Algibacter sp.]